MTPISGNVHRMLTRVLLMSVILLAGYMVLFDSSVVHDLEDLIDMDELEQELDSGNPVRIVSYKSPLDENLFRPWPEVNAGVDSMLAEQLVRGVDNCHTGLNSAKRIKKYNKLWKKADRMISRDGLWPNSPDVDAILNALASACIVNVDVLDIGEYESGTGEKWLATLEGGQKAVMKIIWEEKGDMKRGGLCNYGFELPTAEIAAFHLHRVLGFYNTPFVTGRKLNLLNDILPFASPAVAKQIKVKRGNETCISGTCYNCKIQHTMCPRDGIVEASVAYWIPRKIRLHTFPPGYMPFATTRMEEWQSVGFNDRSYCSKVRESVDPYQVDQLYYDLFDFAVIDTLMYHYDSKHYTINDNSDAQGLTIRLDHGRAFCAYDHDEEHVFLAPLKQCCTLRKSTYAKLKRLQNGKLSKELRQALSSDPIAPILNQVWYPTLDRRLKLILNMIEQCTTARGKEDVFV